MSEVKQVMIEQELMRRVVVQILRNQRRILELSMFIPSMSPSKEVIELTGEYLVQTTDILDELED
jgi:hypothetical protein